MKAYVEKYMTYSAELLQVYKKESQRGHGDTQVSDGTDGRQPPG